MPMAERPGRRFHRRCQPVSPSKRDEGRPLRRSWVTDQLVIGQYLLSLLSPVYNLLPRSKSIKGPMNIKFRDYSFFCKY